MTIEQAAITWICFCIAAAAIGVGGWQLRRRWRDHRFMQRQHRTEKERRDTIIGWASWDQEVFGADYIDAVKAEMKREYRHIPEATDAEHR